MEYVHDIMTQVETVYEVDKVKASISTNETSGDHTVEVEKVDSDGAVYNPRKIIVTKVFLAANWTEAVAHYEALIGQLYEQSVIRGV